MSDSITIRAEDLEKIAGLARNAEAVVVEITHQALEKKGSWGFGPEQGQWGRRAYMVLFHQSDGAFSEMLYVSGRPGKSERDTADVVLIAAQESLLQESPPDDHSG